MASQNSSTSSTVTMPTALVFLVSNFSNFVTIKLDAHNYILWKNQVRNALRANGYLGFIDGSTVMPCPKIQDANQNKAPNPEYAKWIMINGHLLACITASVSPSIQTHLLGLGHVYEIWTSLSNRFSSLSRSHVHDLHQRLFNITKTSTMQEYIDEISDCAHKLAASGSPIDDEDLIFYALNGLPSEFDPIKSAARMRAGDLKFEELTSLLEAEDMILQKAQKRSSAKPDGSTILVATQTSRI
ncbi:hypothetical protein Vadar_010596 [Vaccinium darrowii]|uniref:Uncharacterized protein n=1 Tax=Vaccinium darrowii TaxID=229202 RepID=A0ACB7Z2U4_9ERIC|nr:hypothetical protein Vadar_010596 [Vaccinium darrowii]